MYLDISIGNILQCYVLVIFSYSQIVCSFTFSWTFQSRSGLWSKTTEPCGAVVTKSHQPVGESHKRGSASSACHYSSVMLLVLMTFPSIHHSQGVIQTHDSPGKALHYWEEEQKHPGRFSSADRWEAIVNILIDGGWGQGVNLCFPYKWGGRESNAGCWLVFDRPPIPLHGRVQRHWRLVKVSMDLKNVADMFCVSDLILNVKFLLIWEEYRITKMLYIHLTIVYVFDCMGNNCCCCCPPMTDGSDPRDCFFVKFRPDQM